MTFSKVSSAICLIVGLALLYQASILQSGYTQALLVLVLSPVLFALAEIIDRLNKVLAALKPNQETPEDP